MLLLFTEFVSSDDPLLHYNIGWFVILVTLGNVLVNMSYMLYQSALELKLIAKQLCKRAKIKLEQRRKAKLHSQTSHNTFAETPLRTID